MASVFITGGSGYIGRELSAKLLSRGHRVRALVREESLGKLAPGCEAVFGNALEEASFRDAVREGEVFVHLIGVAHPSPAKGEQFRAIDLVSIRAAVAAAARAGVGHFVYVSVAHPAPMMKEYVAAREEGEALLRGSGMAAAILRPWYVLGPGHRWPYVLLPGYWIAERLASTREAALRLGLVTRRQMVSALVAAVETPPAGIRVLEVPEIRNAAAG